SPKRTAAKAWSPAIVLSLGATSSISHAYLASVAACFFKPRRTSGLDRRLRILSPQRRSVARMANTPFLRESFSDSPQEGGATVRPVLPTEEPACALSGGA